MDDVRLIDANHLEKKMLRYAHHTCHETTSTAESCAEMVRCAPTIDPESMRGHARWQKDENVKIIDVDAYGNTFESPAVYCENCNAALSEADFRGRVWNFCPVCGFKMEDGTNG